MSTDTPKVDLPPYVIRLERENARLREDIARHVESLSAEITESDRLRDELSLANGTIESRDRNIATLQEELAEAKRERGELILAARIAIPDSEHPTEETAANWSLQIRNLGADRRLEKQRAEQAESRALAAEKDAGRYRWLRSRVPGGTYRIMGIVYSEGGSGVDAAIDAAIGAKHE